MAQQTLLDRRSGCIHSKCGGAMFNKSLSHGHALGSWDQQGVKQEASANVIQDKEWLMRTCQIILDRTDIATGQFMA